MITPKHMIISMIAIAASVPAWAGHGEGNGGGAYVCRNPLNQNDIRWAELVDLWEGRSPLVMKLEIPKTNEVPAKEQSKAAIQKLKAHHPVMFSQVSTEMEMIWQKIDHAIETGDTGTYLSVVDDSLDAIRPRVCPGSPEQRPVYEQVINYISDEEVRVDVQLYQALESETDRAALAVHEAVYKVFRAYESAADSRRTRKVTAAMFSNMTAEAFGQLLKAQIRSDLTPKGFVKEVLLPKLDKAIYDGDVEFVRALVEFRSRFFGEEVRVQVTPKHLGDALDYMTWKHPNEMQIVQVLWSQLGPDFDVNEKIKDAIGLRENLLAKTVRAQSVELMKLILSHPSFDPEKSNEFPFASEAIEYAVSSGCGPCILVLLDDGRFDPRGKDKDNDPVSIAIRRGHVELVRPFFESKNPISVNERNDFGDTLLGAAIHDRGELAVFKYLLDLPGVDVNASSKYGKTPLAQAISVTREIGGKKIQGDFEAFSLLLDRKELIVSRQEGFDESASYKILRDFDDEERAIQWISLLIERHPEVDLFGPQADQGGSLPLFAKNKGWYRLEAMVEKHRPSAPKGQEPGFWDWLWSWIPKF